MSTEQTTQEPQSMTMINQSALVDALAKFQRWNEEYCQIEQQYSPKDAAESLLSVLGETSSACLIGGSNAPIFKYAAEEIRRLRQQHIDDCRKITEMDDVLNQVALSIKPHGAYYEPWLPPDLLKKVHDAMLETPQGE